MKYKFIIEKNEKEILHGYEPVKEICIQEALHEFQKRTAKIDEHKMKISAHDCLDMGMTLAVEDNDGNKISVKVIDNFKMN